MNVNRVFDMKNNFIYKVIAFVLAIVLVVIISSSSYVLVQEVHHSCNDSSCHVCYDISVAKSYMNGINLGEILVQIVFIDVLSVMYLDKFSRTEFRPNTLVSLKVKLSN